MRSVFQFILITTLIYAVFGIAKVQIDQLNKLVYSLNITALVLFIYRMGSYMVIPEFISFSAITMWLSTPLLIWDLGLDKYMVPNLFGSEVLALDIETYYAWALPATLSMVLGLSFFQIKKEKLREQINRLQKYLREEVSYQTPLYLFAIGVFGTVVGKFMPGSLAFIFFLFAQFVYISVLYCLFGDFSYSKWIYFGAFALTLLYSVSSGMFGKLMWWGVIMAFFIMLKWKWRFSRKIILITTGLFSVFVLQSVKAEYRRITWATPGENQGDITLLKDLVVKSATTFDIKSAKIAPLLILNRANQAYIISLVMEHVPKKEPFVNGETVFMALAGSFVPRFLWPSKPQSGGHNNIRRFAGYTPHGSTSYDISQLGDAWVNFGFYGGIVFMFIYGLFNTWTLKRIFNYAHRKSPALILWVPMIFLQLLKVEVSVETNFNAAIKGAIFIFVVFSFTSKLQVKI